MVQPGVDHQRIAHVPFGERDRRASLKIVSIILLVVSVLVGCTSPSGVYDDRIKRVQTSAFKPETEKVQADKDGYAAIVLNVSSRFTALDVEDIELRHAESGMWYGIMRQHWVLDMNPDTTSGTLRLLVRVNKGESTFDTIKVQLPKNAGFVTFRIQKVHVSYQ
jgi:hypothetical protein